MEGAGVCDVEGKREAYAESSSNAACAGRFWRASDARADDSYARSTFTFAPWIRCRTRRPLAHVAWRPGSARGTEMRVDFEHERTSMPTRALMHFCRPTLACVSNGLYFTMLCKPVSYGVPA